MIHAAKFIKRIVCSMVVILAILAGIAAIPVQAASSGVYTATATSHYRHPSTGVIEDSGGEGSYVLGQSMTESALNKSALVEIDSSGNTWVTIRLNLMDNIESPKFQVDSSRNGKFSSVSADIMQEDFTANTTDFRMKVPNENCVIRCNMYVIPMGREVVFYITVDNLKSGSGDFVASVKAEQTEVLSDAPSQAEQPAASTSEDNNIDASKTTEQADDSGEALNDEDSNESTEGLEEFDESGNKVDATETNEENNHSSNSNSTILWWILGGAVILAVAGACIWYFVFKKRK